jgi:hypothetical protein
MLLVVAIPVWQIYIKQHHEEKKKIENDQKK